MTKPKYNSLMTNAKDYAAIIFGLMLYAFALVIRLLYLGLVIMVFVYINIILD